MFFLYIGPVIFPPRFRVSVFCKPRLLASNIRIFEHIDRKLIQRGSSIYFQIFLHAARDDSGLGEARLFAMRIDTGLEFWI